MALLTRRRGLLYSLYIVSVLLMVVGWFIERAASFAPILRLVSPDYVAAKAAFTILDIDAKGKLPPDHPGFQVLLKWWEPAPPSEVRSLVSGIGRTVGVTDIKEAKQYYLLRLLFEQNTKQVTQFDWRDIEAKKKMQETLSKATVTWSLWLFFAGVVLNIGIFVWDHTSG